MALTDSTLAGARNARRRTRRPIRRFTLDEYHWLIEHGFFPPEDRVELLEGQLVEMIPIYPPHASTVTRLGKLFERRVGERVLVRSQQPLTLIDQSSEPEPDIALCTLHADAAEFDRRHPYPHDVLLVCEVSDATLAFDRKQKMNTYARAAIQEYWVVNLPERQLEVYRTPAPSGKRFVYLQSLRVKPGESIAPAALPDCEVDPALFLPQ
jgi:Uma2 family endonuclease